MAATFDSTSFHAFQSTTSTNWAHTLGGGSNLVAVVLVAFAWPTAVTLDSVTYGAQSMTRVPSSLASDAAGGHTELFYLIAPSGNQTVTCNFSRSCDNVCGIIVGQDSNQITPLGTAATNSGTGVSTLSVTVSSATDEMSVGCLLGDLSVSNTTITTTNTGVERWRDNTGAPTTNIDGGGSTITGSASAVHTWTMSNTCFLAASGVSIKPQPPVTTAFWHAPTRVGP